MPAPRDIHDEIRRLESRSTFPSWDTKEELAKLYAQLLRGNGEPAKPAEGAA